MLDTAAGMGSCPKKAPHKDSFPHDRENKELGTSSASLVEVALWTVRLRAESSTVIPLIAAKRERVRYNIDDFEQVA